MVHTPSVSIKNVLQGKRDVPIVNREIEEDDVVKKSNPSDLSDINITEEMVVQAWNDYAASIEKSKPRVFNTLKQHRPEMPEPGKITIQLNTQAQRENFIHNIKPSLTRYFQQNLADIDYVFETNLIENEIVIKKMYTDQDKLEFLMNKNKELEKLKNRFNLDFDS